MTKLREAKTHLKWDMVEIPLTKGEKLIIDLKAYDEIPEFKNNWYTHNCGFAARNVRDSITNKYTLILAHRIVWQHFNGPIKPKHRIIHVSDKLLDCRLKNLKETTMGEMHTKRREDGKYSSKYLGVTYHKLNNRWNAQIRIDKVNKCIGAFKTPEEAAKRYNEMALKILGPNTLLNEV